MLKITQHLRTETKSFRATSSLLTLCLRDCMTNKEGSLEYITRVGESQKEWVWMDKTVVSKEGGIEGTQVTLGRSGMSESSWHTWYHKNSTEWHHTVRMEMSHSYVRWNSLQDIWGNDDCILLFILVGLWGPVFLWYDFVINFQCAITWRTFQILTQINKSVMENGGNDDVCDSFIIFCMCYLM